MPSDEPTGGAHPWADGDGNVDEFAIVEDFGDALFAAGERCMRYRGLMLAARREDERDPRPNGKLRRTEEVRTAFIGFIRRTVALVGVATFLGELPEPVTTETPP